LDSLILTVSCKDRPGIISLVTKFLSENGFNITESDQFNDKETGNFFMRTEFHQIENNYQISKEFMKKLNMKFKESVESKLNMKWDIDLANKNCPVLILVSKEDHCVNNLIYKSKNFNVPIDIKGVVSNHKNLEKSVGKAGIPFHYFPLTTKLKAAQENKILNLFNSTGSELIILARYMQILSEEFCEKLTGKAINIHHSFLPGFKGAKPYHQAHKRGVKIIGATSHYVTKELDEGPIIEQEIIRVNHSMTPEILMEMGKDIESMVLSKSVKLHCEKRIFINDKKTIIFNR